MIWTPRYWSESIFYILCLWDENSHMGTTVSFKVLLKSIVFTYIQVTDIAAWDEAVDQLSVLLCKNIL